MIKVAFGIFIAVLGLTSFTYFNKNFEPDYAAMMDNVVKIEAINEEGKEVGHGSGVILENGDIISASHVFAGADPKIKFRIKTNNGDFSGLTIVKDVPEKDLIVVRPTVTLGKKGAKLYCEPVKLGTRVISMGSPTFLEFIMTWGRVSGERVTPEALEGKPIMIIDAPLGPGMSGGPTFDREGRVIGINDAILTVPQKVVGPAEKEEEPRFVSGFLGIYILVPAEDVCKEVGPIS